ncbi:MAG: DUF1963 domain-containing protein [Pseudomonadota bacterium]
MAIVIAIIAIGITLFFLVGYLDKHSKRLDRRALGVDPDPVPPRAIPPGAPPSGHVRAEAGAPIGAAKHNSGPPITVSEVEAYLAAIEDARLPVAEINTFGAAPDRPAQSCLLGRPYADVTHSDWPQNADGSGPMLFIAQINFAEVPAMEDFPAKGLLQLFIEGPDSRRYDLWVPQPDAVHVRWFEDPQGDAALPLPITQRVEALDYFFRESAIEDGLAMSFTAGTMPGNPNIAPLLDMRTAMNGRAVETQAVQARLDQADHEANCIIDAIGDTGHYIGGQPNMAMEDLRSELDLAHLDRVLLHLGYDWDEEEAVVNIGGAGGSLDILISRKDLRDRQFGRLRWLASGHRVPYTEDQPVP